MLPFYNLEIPSNPYQMAYSPLPILNFVNPMLQNQYYPTQQMICLGYLPKIENFQLRTSTFSPLISDYQTDYLQQSTVLRQNKVKFEFQNQIERKQNNQQFQMLVPKTKLNKKIHKVKYLKKNTESNISNQVLTFLSDEKKSKDYLIRLAQKSMVGEKEVISKFYEWMDVIKSSTKKYISKKILLCLSTPSSEHILFKEFSKMNINLSEHELNSFCKIARILMRIFLTEFSHLTVLTSKKIHRQGAIEHLIRRRQIKNYLEQRHTKI